MNYSGFPITKLTSTIYRCTQSYANEVLKPYHLSSGTYPFLFILNNKEGINQNQISKELNVDKAMSARAIKQLVDLGYLVKQEDDLDSRANKLYLTDKGKAIVPVVKEELDKWNMKLTKGIGEEEQTMIRDLLGRILENARDEK